MFSNEVRVLFGSQNKAGKMEFIIHLMKVSHPFVKKHLFQKKNFGKNGFGKIRRENMELLEETKTRPGMTKIFQY